MQDIISALDLDADRVNEIFSTADRFGSGRVPSLKGRILSLAFFEPSTRTYTSFEVAARKLSLEVTGFRLEESTSVAKGESYSDTVRMLSSYSDCMVIRHRYEGAARFAAELSNKPVINAGDGRNEHPTQAILDLYTVKKSFGSLGKLTYGFVGDLRYSRTVNSLLYLLTKFRPRMVYLISPQQLRTRPEVLESLNYRCEEVERASDVAGEVDVLYVTRVQKERFTEESEYKKAKGSYTIDQRLVDELKDRAIILHPLPRVDEIDRRIDTSEKVKYFEEARNGVAVREAILWKVMSE